MGQLVLCVWVSSQWLIDVTQVKPISEQPISLSFIFLFSDLVKVVIEVLARVLGEIVALKSNGWLFFL